MGSWDLFVFNTVKQTSRNTSDTTVLHCSIKKPKTYKYPSLKGTDPKFRRNHKHALHGTAKALVCNNFLGPPAPGYLKASTSTKRLQINRKNPH